MQIDGALIANFRATGAAARTLEAEGFDGILSFEGAHDPSCRSRRRPSTRAISSLRRSRATIPTARGGASSDVRPEPEPFRVTRAF